AGRALPAVVAVAAGQTMRQACPSAGIDPDGDIVGIPEIYFDLPKATRKHLPRFRERLLFVFVVYGQN
ncbi:hypothetical protein, partial [Cypionkella sp.]|uniref:hypothetical protein n=1 Tax=Cypionkella sp. TaxID=2811411 RepID=UPI002FDCC9D5